MSNSEVGRDGPQTRSLVEIENKSKKINKSAADAARNATAEHQMAHGAGVSRDAANPLVVAVRNRHAVNA